MMSGDLGFEIKKIKMENRNWLIAILSNLLVLAILLQRLEKEIFNLKSHG